MKEIRIEGPENKAKKALQDTLEIPFPQKKEKMTVGYLDVIVIALMVAFLSLAVYDQYFASRVMVVDLTGFVKEQKELFVQGKINEADLSARLAQFQDFLSKQPKNVTVITRDVVLSGGKELQNPSGSAGQATVVPGKK